MTLYDSHLEFSNKAKRVLSHQPASPSFCSCGTPVLIKELICVAKVEIARIRNHVCSAKPLVKQSKWQYFRRQPCTVECHYVALNILYYFRSGVICLSGRCLSGRYVSGLCLSRRCLSGRYLSGRSLTGRCLSKRNQSSRCHIRYHHGPKNPAICSNMEVLSVCS